MSVLSRHLFGWLWKVVVLVLIVAAARSSLADWSDVPTRSMTPAIVPGDRIYVNKLAYGLRVPFTTWRVVSWGEPGRGDVVTLLSPRDGTLLVKRIAAAAGDTVEGREGERVPPGKFYVLGDNREHSADSRSFGFVDRGQIMGRVSGIIFSLDPDYRLSFRRDRFFTGIAPR